MFIARDAPTAIIGTASYTADIANLNNLFLFFLGGKGGKPVQLNSHPSIFPSVISGNTGTFLNSRGLPQTLTVM